MVLMGVGGVPYHTATPLAESCVLDENVNQKQRRRTTSILTLLHVYYIQYER